MQKFSLFISDLHLQQEDPQVTARFVRFMHDIAPQAERLYVLGDLFNAWIGDDDSAAFNVKISTQFTQLSAQGVKIFFMPGNRDFLIGTKFATRCSFERLKDPSVITLYGHRLALTHGDLLCTKDTRHQKYRTLTLNPLTQRMFLILPLWLRRKIANALRNNSGHHQQTSHDLMDVTESEACTLMQQTQTKIMIHGHTHRPAIHHMENKTLTRIVLGAWHDHADYLKFNQKGQFELLTLN